MTEYGSGTGTPTPPAIPPTVPASNSPLVVPVRDYNLLPLESWRSFVSYHPWHFWGLAGTKAPMTSNCNAIVRQYAWQGADAAGRQEILDAIEGAERRLLPYLHYEPAPRWKECTLEFPRYPQVNVAKFGYAASDGRWVALQLPDGNVQSIGTEGLNLIQTVNVVYSDADGDGLKETFTLTVPTSVTDARQIAVYFSAADRYTGEGYIERWRIRPLIIKIAAGTATITGKSWLAVKPMLYEGVSTEFLEATTATNYATTMDVCYHFDYKDGTTYQTAQAALIWESPPYPQWASNYSLPAPAGIDPAGQAFAIARCEIRNSEIGEVYLGEAIYDTTQAMWYAVPWYASAYKFRPPDRVVIRYRAGYPTDEYGNMQTEWERVVSKFAAAELNRRVCACEEANRAIYHWQFDLARTGGSETFSSISREDLANPFGTRRGHVEAWRAVKARRVLTGFSP